MEDIIEFKTQDEQLPKIKIDGEMFSVKPIGAGMLLDIQELSTDISGSDKGDTKKMRLLFNSIESLLIAEGKLTPHEVLTKIPVKKLGDFVKLLSEV